MGGKKTKQKFYMFGISFEIDDTNRIDDKTIYVNILFYREWIRDITSDMPWYITKSLSWDRHRPLSYYRYRNNGGIQIQNKIFVTTFVILYYIVDLTLLITK